VASRLCLSGRVGTGRGERSSGHTIQLSVRIECGALAEDVWHRDVAPERAEVGEDVPRPPQPILGLREVEQQEDNVLLIAAAAWLVMLGALAATAVVAAWLWPR